jgi:hypothetical protein
MITIHIVDDLDCGDPPMINTATIPDYVSYFCNRFGEQWSFKFDRKTRTGELRGGDVGWNESFEVTDDICTDLLLGQEESLRLATCWAATN